MSEEKGHEVTPNQSLDGLWRTMHKYIEHHGYSDISLELEGSQYEFRQHLQKYDEYEAKAKAFDEIMFTVKNVKRDTPFNTTIRNIVRQYEKEYESGEYDVEK